jgi:Flp pilus assembly protein TadG
MITKLHSERGQTLVEFALTLVLLLFVIFGIVEFGIILYDKAIVTGASREGARAGAMFRVDTGTFAYSPLSANDIRTAVGNYVSTNGLVTFGPAFNATTDVTPQWSVDGGNTWTTTLPLTHGDGTKIRVDVALNYTYLLLPRLRSFGGGTLNLSSTTIMRLE